MIEMIKSYSIQLVNYPFENLKDSQKWATEHVSLQQSTSNAIKLVINN